MKIYYTDFDSMALNMEEGGTEEGEIQKVLDKLRDKLDLGSIPGVKVIGDYVFADKHIKKLWGKKYFIKMEKLDLKSYWENGASKIYGNMAS